MLPLTSHLWSNESADTDGDSQFNVRISDVALSYYGSASVRPMLAPSRPKPTEDDSFMISPPQVLSDSTFSLLSRKYSPSSTDSSCECSETSSVDENFMCGSGSPTMDATNWEDSSEHSSEDLSAETSDGEHKSFSLLTATPDASMIIPLAGVTVTEQPLSQTHGDLVYEDSTEEYVVSAVAGREPAGLEIYSEVTPIGTKDKTESARILPTTTDDLADVNNKVETTSLTQLESILVPASASLVVASPLRSSLSSSTHTCSTCHLYAPSSSASFYLDAWLNQQNDIHPSSVEEDKAKVKKRVSWPDTTAELRTVIVVEKWIEKGVHVHPQPKPRSERMDNSDDSEDDCDTSERKEEGAIRLKEVITLIPKTPVQQSEAPIHPARQGLSTGSSKDSDCDSVSSAASVRWNDDAVSNTQKKLECHTPVTRKPLVQVQRKPEPQPVKRPSPPSSVSSSSSSTTSSSVPPKQQAVPQPKQYKSGVSTPLPNNTPRVVTQLPVPKKKYSSGVTVKIIGGPYSEHEAAMKIRGVDPIKHRSMIENYWQF